MNALRLLLTLCSALVVVAGCGGSQPPIGAPGTVPHGAATHARAHRATSGTLIYATGGCDGICVLSYPQGQIIDSIRASGFVGGLCSDNVGNVFVTNGNQVLEYQHGATSPVATLALPGNNATGCSVDPATNNLAVIFRATGGLGDVAIFDSESGSPTLYGSKIDSFYCGFDNSGNLFVSGFNNGSNGLSELPSGEGEFRPLTIKGKIGLHGQVQWDGSHLTYQSLALQRPSIAQLSIAGSVAKVISTTKLKGNIRHTAQSWIYNGQLLVPYSRRGLHVDRIGIWSYPKGGNAINALTFNNSKAWQMQGIAVSVAQTAKEQL